MATNIGYKQFLNIIKKYDNFNKNTLKVLYDEFGEGQINMYFDYCYQSLDKEEAVVFYNKYYAYFDSIKNYNLMLDNECVDVSKILIDDASKYEIMSPEMEKEQGINLLNGKRNLKIIKNIGEYVLYPDLELEKIFLSVKSIEDLNLIKKIKKLPFSLNDESIFRNDIKLIKKFINLSKDRLLDVEQLKEEFTELSFDNIECVDDLNSQVDLLKKYIVAKFNFYNRNLKLVVWYARKVNGDYLLEDKIQEGNLGLIKAINKFDVEKNNRFCTYALFWIKQKITNYVEHNAYAVCVPNYLLIDIAKYKKFVDQYEACYGVSPSIEECVKNLNMSKEKVCSLASVSLDSYSLDVLYGEEYSKEKFVNLISDENALFEDKIISREFVCTIVDGLKKGLNERDFDILISRLGFNNIDKAFTLQELSDKMGLTRERIRQLENRGKMLLRRLLLKNEIDRY